MTRSDDKKIAALIRKNLAKANPPAPKGGTKRRQYDPTLQSEPEEDSERSRFFKEMKKREF